MPLALACKFAIDMDKQVVTGNFEKRGWTCVTAEDDWNVYWASVLAVRALFSADSSYRLGDDQIVNHFPNHFELTRKDLIVKNVRRFRKELEKDNNPLGARTSGGRLLHFDFMPVTYMLPADYSLFVEEYRKCPHTTWIMKPVGRARGVGIFLIKKLSEIKKFTKEVKALLSSQTAGQKDTYIISRYIDRPLLVGRKKFDLRLFVLVTSFRPLKAYLHKSGFCRFCTVKYDANTADIDNVFAHLTNVSIQKCGVDYNSVHGGKWSLDNLRLYVESTRGSGECEIMFDKIKDCILLSLMSVSNVIRNDKHCFELYGYDVIVEENLKPWLIEVNASPSLTSTTAADKCMKFELINDILNIVLPNNKTPDLRRGRKQGPAEKLGQFEVLVDEDVAPPSLFTKFPATSNRKI